MVYFCFAKKKRKQLKSNVFNSWLDVIINFRFLLRNRVYYYWKWVETTKNKFRWFYCMSRFFFFIYLDCRRVSWFAIPIRNRIPDQWIARSCSLRESSDRVLKNQRAAFKCHKQNQMDRSYRSVSKSHLKFSILMISIAARENFPPSNI